MKDPESGCPVYTLEGGIKVIVVETLRGLAHALAELRQSMQVGTFRPASVQFDSHSEVLCQSQLLRITKSILNLYRKQLALLMKYRYF